MTQPLGQVGLAVCARRGYSMMASTSSSFMIRYSWSSTFTSDPEYFPNRMRSWAFTSRAIFLPSSFTFPLPTAMTLPSWGFSLAVSGMMMPPFLTSFSSSRLTRMRSCNGRIFMVRSPPDGKGWNLVGDPDQRGAFSPQRYRQQSGRSRSTALAVPRRIDPPRSCGRPVPIVTVKPASKRALRLATAEARAGRHRHAPSLGRARLGGLDFDHPPRRGARRGDPHLEHAVRALGLHLGGVDALGQREAPLECAVRDLADEIVLARAVGVGLALALDGEDVVHHGHLDALRIHARQGELDDIGVVLEPLFRGGQPRCGRLNRLVRGAVEEPREQSVDVVVVVKVQFRHVGGPASHGGHGVFFSRHLLW